MSGKQGLFGRSYWTIPANNAGQVAAKNRVVQIGWRGDLQGGWCSVPERAARG